MPKKAWARLADIDGQPRNLRQHAALQDVETQQLEHQADQLRAQAKQLLIKHEFQQAEDVLTHALQLRPGAYKLLRLRSVAFACLQQYQRSLQDADDLIIAMPGLTDGYYHKGFALYHLGEYSDAAHAFQQALDLNPGDRVLQQGFWDAMILLSQHRRDDVPMVGRPERTRSVSKTLALLHAQRMQRRALEYEDR